MKTVPFTRQEMIDCIEGRPTRRPAVAIGTWIHLDQLSEDKQRRLEKLYADYPFDMEAFYIKKPATFGQPGDRFCWCDVKDADPHIGRTKSVGVDEENAISWEVYDQITPELPDPAGVDLFEGWPEDDGRYRMAWLSYGPWSRIWEYRGMTNSLMDLYTDPARVQSINDRTMRWFKEVIDQVAAGHRADAIGFGDDHGMQKGPFMSPKMFRKFYFPFYKELCDYAHSRGLHVWLHCCGDAMKLSSSWQASTFCTRFRNTPWTRPQSWRSTAGKSLSGPAWTFSRSCPSARRKTSARKCTILWTPSMPRRKPAPFSRSPTAWKTTCRWKTLRPSSRKSMRTPKVKRLLLPMPAAREHDATVTWTDTRQTEERGTEDERTGKNPHRTH